MKKYLLLLLAFILSVSVFAQEKKVDSLPYQKYPTMPALKILMTDSIRMINTYDIPQGRPTILIYFSPDCDHCEKTTKSIIDHMEDLKQARILLFSPMSMTAIRGFAEKLNLGEYKNILIGQNYDNTFTGFYAPNYVPFIVIYDRDKKLVRSFEGGGKIEDIIEAAR